ncbi:MAG: nucleotidyltransferase domain-containing protein [Deltaproteobacteria bacterium]|nr:nucleotidyltransferase domain-containing protein [Deltaproteobacteria bacterium]
MKKVSKLFDISPFQKELTVFCRNWKIKSIALFGSAIRDDFSEQSDVDLLITYHRDASHDLLDLSDMIVGLEKIFNRKVDIVEREAVEKSGSQLLKEEILGSAKTIYDEAA